MIESDIDINGGASFIDMTTAAEENVKALITEYGLHSTVPFLREVGKCLCAEGLTPNGEILRFFDAIFVCATSQSKNINITELYANDKEVVKTFSDMFEKHKYLSDGMTDSVSLDDMMHVASRYLSTLSIYPIPSVSVTNVQKDVSVSNSQGRELICLGLNNSKPLPYGYKSDEYKEETDRTIADKDDVFILITGDNEQTLLNNASFKDALKAIIKIDEGGILHAIAEHSHGATVYADSEAVSGNLSDLVNLHKNKKVIIVSKENDMAVTYLLEEHSACAYKLAVASDSPVFTLVTQTRTFNIRATFLRRIFRHNTKFVPRIPTASFEPTRYDTLYCGGNTTERLISKKGHLISVLCTSDCSFTNGINTALDSLFALLAKGIDRRKICITVKICYTADHLSEAVAALLGIYRVAIEMCIPEKDSSIELSDADYILCCAYAREEGEIPQTFKAAKSSAAHLFSFGRFDDTTPPLMPDFCAVRKMCDRVSDMISKNQVLAAMSVNGSVYKTTKEMCPKGVWLSEISDGINDKTGAQGLIIQLNDGTETNAPIIGVIQKESL